MYVSIPDCFMISFCVGLVFGLIYEALRIIRVILPLRFIIFICDVVFFMLSAFIIMTLSEILGSYIRIYTVMGFGVGIFTYIVTIGRLFNAAENAASNAWRKTLRKLLDCIANMLLKTFSKIAHKSKSIIGKYAEYRKVKMKNSSEDLKSDNKILYNKKELEKIGGRTDVIKASVRKSS